MSEITGTIKNWVVAGICICGELYNDSRKRWSDGTHIRTSRIAGNLTELKEGSTVNTKNSTYILGKKLSE